MMKKKWRLILMILIVVIVGSGCGTSQSGNEPDGTNGSAPIVEPVSEHTEDEDVSPGETMIRLIDMLLPYQYEGEQYEESAFINHSSNQGFSMYVYENFQLEAEEPGKDMILYTDDDQVFMRIEVLSKDSNLELVEESSIEQLKAVSETVHRHVWAQPNDLLEGAIMLHADNQSEWGQIILTQQNEVNPAMKLTIHVSDIEKHGELVAKLLAMAKTVMLEGPAN